MASSVVVNDKGFTVLYEAQDPVVEYVSLNPMPSCSRVCKTYDN